MPANTKARGKIVSRFPRGICNTTANVVGMTETSFAPLSMLRQRSSTSGSSEGISRSIKKRSIMPFAHTYLLTFSLRQMYEFEEMVGSGCNKMRIRDQKGRAVAYQKSFISIE